MSGQNQVTAVEVPYSAVKPAPIAVDSSRTAKNLQNDALRPHVPRDFWRFTHLLSELKTIKRADGY